MSGSDLIVSPQTFRAPALVGSCFSVPRRLGIKSRARKKDKQGLLSQEVLHLHLTISLSA